MGALPYHLMGQCHIIVPDAHGRAIATVRALLAVPAKEITEALQER